MLTISKKASNFILLAILLISFGLNIYGNDFSLGYHADEMKKVDFILFGEQDFKHPILILQTARLANLFLGLHTRMPIVILSRITTAMFGTLIVLLTLKLARQRLARGFALGASALTAVSPGIVIHSHYLKEDIAFTFATLLSILCFFNLVQHLLKTSDTKIPWPQILLLGIGIGFVVSAKYKSGIVLLTFFLVPIYLPKLRTLTYLRTLFLAFVAGFFVFLLINFPILTNFATFVEGFTFELTHAFSGHNGVNIYPLEQFFTFHLRDSILPSMTPLPVLGAVGFVIYGLLRWGNLNWRDKFLISFLFVFYAIIESSPLKPCPGYVRYIVPLIPILAYACMHAVQMATTKLPTSMRNPIALLAISIIILLPTLDSLNLVRHINQDTRDQLDAMLATKQEPSAYEFYTRGRGLISAKSLFELDQQIKDKSVCTVVASSFMYERYLFASEFENQDDSVYDIADWYQTLFDTYPHTDIVPAHKSFAFSNPTLKVIDVCS